MGGHNELRFGVPLVVGDIVPSLEPDPLLALGEEPVVARCALTSLHEGLMAHSHLLQVIHMVIVIPRGPKQLKC